jgi:hypothetical protein
MGETTQWDRERALSELRAGRIREFNEYRQAHPDWCPRLSDKDHPADLNGVRLFGDDPGGASVAANRSKAVLNEADLMMADARGADFTGATLRGANLNAADLRTAKLAHADLTDANLNGADLREARFPGSRMERASLIGADLREANFELADCVAANFQHSDLRGADLIGVNLSGANVAGVRYDRRLMPGRFENIRASACHGNAIFRRDAEDQAFLDALYSSIDKQRGIRRHSRRVGMFLWWLLTDYGRSFLRVSVFALLAAMVFGIAYDVLDCIAIDALAGAEPTGFTPYYYSIVTYTRGFGTAVPSTLLGEWLVTTEVVFGYITLGLMLSILGNRIARRA